MVYQANWNFNAKPCSWCEKLCSKRDLVHVASTDEYLCRFCYQFATWEDVQKTYNYEICVWLVGKGISWI